MPYLVEYLPGVLKRDVPALPKTMRTRIAVAIMERLAVDPVSYGKPLRGSLKGHRRMRVGDYRIVYRILSEAQRVDIIAIAHRKEIYEDL